jgi:prevent-host-death family protein
MNQTWQIQDAKNKLSEVIARALAQGPQLITKHGEKTVVVISYTEYENLRKSQGKLSKEPVTDGGELKGTALFLPFPEPSDPPFDRAIDRPGQIGGNLGPLSDGERILRDEDCHEKKEHQN